MLLPFVAHSPIVVLVFAIVVVVVVIVVVSITKVTEADYLIFKLMQLQRVDEDILHRLQERFDELDNDLVGCLEVV
jgi:hypothetical protein